MELNPNFNFEADGIGKSVYQEAKKLKENFSPKYPDHSEILDKLLNQIQLLDFSVFIYPEIRELEQLRNEKNRVGLDGELEPNLSFTEKQNSRLEELDKKKFKVTQKQQKVVIVQELQKIALHNNWGLCQNHGSVYIYNGCYWKRLDKSELETFLGKAARKMGVNAIDAKECIFKAQLVAQFFSDAVLPKPLLANGRVIINFQNGTPHYWTFSKIIIGTGILFRPNSLNRCRQKVIRLAQNRIKLFMPCLNMDSSLSCEPLAYFLTRTFLYVFSPSLIEST